MSFMKSNPVVIFVGAVLGLGVAFGFMVLAGLLLMLLFNRVAPVYGIDIVIGHCDAILTLCLITVLGGAFKGFNLNFNKKKD